MRGANIVEKSEGAAGDSGSGRLGDRCCGALLHSLHASQDSRLSRGRRLSPMELLVLELPRAARWNVPGQGALADSGRDQCGWETLVLAGSFSRPARAD